MAVENKNAQLAALYARVSSDLQSAVSIEDQLRMCKEHAAKEGLADRRELHRPGHLRG